ncbi:hypothetical protein DFH07DRAFT_1059884 [Mycena maculata]|uniref:F-box domain-containing protein n=1 Tax=Mycena maculata TaxID=230809 RepID=A0AAD7NHG6_9AGAR|nr:hypothetical protein DFH07DRAFT_1059884 [Mycena maculata]
MAMSCWKCGAPEERQICVSLEQDHAHLLETNGAPLDTEILSISQTIADHQARMEVLDGRINALRATLRQPTEEREELAAHAESFSVILSPIRRVPVELVCEIFSWAAESPCTRQIGPHTVVRPPWHLGHICRSWRQIALGYPSLWRSFSIFHAPGHSHLTTFPQSMIETQLLRSANASLVMQLNWKQEEEPPTESPLLDSLFLHSNRWESIHILSNNMECSGMLLEVLRPVKGRLSRLRQLEFLGDGECPPLSQCDIFSIAPNLRHVVLTNSRADQYSPHLHIAWDQITHYNGVFLGAQQLDILRNTPNLIACVLGFDDQHETHGDTMVTLAHLRRFYAEWSHILAYLIAPSLEELCTRGPVGPLASFIQRSSCALTTLVLEKCSSSDGLVPLLGHSPFLRFFMLGALNDTVNFSLVFTAMTVSGSSSDILPHLTSFAYGGPKYFSNQLLPMIRSRLPSRRLSLLRLHSTRAGIAPKTMTDTIQIFADQGLDVQYLDVEEWKSLVVAKRP